MGCGFFHEISFHEKSGNWKQEPRRTFKFHVGMVESVKRSCEETPWQNSQQKNVQLKSEKDKTQMFRELAEINKMQN